MNTSKNLLFYILLIVLTFFYDFLFWHEGWGINLPIFVLLAMVAAFTTFPNALANINALLSTFLTIIIAIFVVLYDAPFAKIILISSLFVTLGFIHQSDVKTTYYAFLTGLTNVFRVPKVLMSRTGEKLIHFPRITSVLRLVSLSLIPIVVFIIFIEIYMQANPAVNNFMNNLFFHIAQWIEQISIPRLLFILSGVIVALGFILNSGFDFYGKQNELQTNDLERFKPLKRRFRRFKFTALRDEYRMAVILLVLVNLAILMENVTDIKLLWFGFAVPVDFSLMWFVREGTFLLIFSILLSIAILLYFFRGNLNFYKSNNLMKILAYLWIAQNVILTISVALRNFYYIDYHGLAYKRLGVYFFIALTAIGLITLALKIAKTKTAYFLLRINSWSLYFMLVFICFFNWNQIVTDYNLHHKNPAEIDVDNYIRLAPADLPLVYSNLPIIQRQMELHAQNRQIWVKHLDIEEFKTEIDTIATEFIRKYEKRTWKSWNVADNKVYTYLKNKPK